MQPESIPRCSLCRERSHFGLRARSHVGYLLHCNFNALESGCWKGPPKLSGWDTDLSGGIIDNSYKKEFDLQWFKLVDTSDKAAVTLKHQIARQTAGELTLEFRFRMPVKMDGICWQLRDLSQAAISIITAGYTLLETARPEHSPPAPLSQP